MPDIHWNYQKWNNTFDWETKKPSWCENTPQNEVDWRCIFFPRIASFLPAHRILEIAPGHGRWTHFLANQCEELTVVDLAPNCIAACKKRFASLSHISYFVNDGLHLHCLADSSIDFVFSFDSLVHCDANVIDSYLSHLSRALTADGTGFIHHSNSAALSRIRDFGPTPVRGGRSTDVSAEIFEQLCRKYGLRCIVQEIINWNSPEPIDCLSLFCRAGSKWDRGNAVFETLDFPERRTAAKRAFLQYVL